MQRLQGPWASGHASESTALLPHHPLQIHSYACTPPTPRPPPPRTPNLLVSGKSKGPPPAVKKVLSLFSSGREEDRMVGYLSFLKVGARSLALCAVTLVGLCMCLRVELAGTHQVDPQQRPRGPHGGLPVLPQGGCWR